MAYLSEEQVTQKISMPFILTLNTNILNFLVLFSTEKMSFRGLVEAILDFLRLEMYLTLIRTFLYQDKYKNNELLLNH